MSSELPSGSASATYVAPSVLSRKEGLLLISGWGVMDLILDSDVFPVTLSFPGVYQSIYVCKSYP